jgi:acetylornithine aminotransferase
MRVIGYPGHDLLLPDIVRAENCHLFDGDGKRYVDLESGVWCTSIGHCNPRVLRTINEQAGRIGHTGYAYGSGVVGAAAEEILSRIGFEGGGCVFLCSGSEAVEYGVRIQQGLAPRPLLMTMADSYFGAYGSAKTRDESEWFSFDWTACGDRACDEGCEHWAAIPFDRIGGFVFEPGSSSGLVRFPPENLVRGIVRVVKENGGLVLVNEVTTGPGRTGAWFGYEHYGIRPDFVAMGKGIGNGYPVAVSAFSAGVMERMGGETPHYAQSHQNDPLGAAVAREVFRIIEEDGLVSRAKEQGAFILEGLEAIRERTARIKEIRGRGLMIAVELNDEPDASFTAWVWPELVRRGFIVSRRPDLNVLRLDPALTIERRDLEEFLATFEELLRG